MSTKHYHAYVEKKGRYTRKTRWGWVLAGIVSALIIGAYGVHIAHGMNITAKVLSPCKQVSKAHYDCTEDMDLLKEWRAWENSQKPLIFKAIQTRYARKDSCHNPKDGKCLTAIGRDTKEGVTVACPRNIPLGTRLLIEGVGERRCEDRYAKYLDMKRGLPTIDIFTEDANLHTVPAYRIALVTILHD